MKPSRPAFKSRQRGVAALEFALVASIGGFLLLLIGIMELSRVLFYMNTASEATRLGARVAVVCDINSPAIRNRMRGMLNILEPDDISVVYSPAGCGPGNCQTVTVSIASNTVVETFIPFMEFSVNLPAFSTTLPRESLNSTSNSLCS